GRLLVVRSPALGRVRRCDGFQESWLNGTPGRRNTRKRWWRATKRRFVIVAGRASRRAAVGGGADRTSPSRFCERPLRRNRPWEQSLSVRPADRSRKGESTCSSFLLLLDCDLARWRLPWRLRRSTP